MERYFGIDVGGTSIKGGIVSKDGKIIFKSACAVKGDALTALDKVVNKLDGYAKENDITVHKCGIGVPCVFDKDTGKVSYGNNLDFKGANLKEWFKVKFNKELFIANDAAAAALGEFSFGAGKGYNNLVLITIGTGVGCGIILDGKIIPSNSSAVGELSHTVISVGGRKCSCGRRGCLETYCSMTALYKDVARVMARNKKSTLWERLDISNIDGRAFFELLGKDESADRIFQNFIAYLAVGVVNVANLLRPDAILIGGGVSAQGEKITNPLNEYLKNQLFAKEYTKAIPVLPAKNGNDAGILGAASLAIN